MLKIRLKRLGNKKQPFYKIVAMESLWKQNGKYIFDLGYYNPLNKKIKINLILFYDLIKKGAYPTNIVRHLLYKIL